MNIPKVSGYSTNFNYNNNTSFKGREPFISQKAFNDAMHLLSENRYDPATKRLFASQILDFIKKGKGTSEISIGGFKSKKGNILATDIYVNNKKIADPKVCFYKNDRPSKGAGFASMLLDALGAS